MVKTHRITFPGATGVDLAARLDVPPGQVRAYAIFAHCFTCSKDIFAAKRISAELARLGVAVLRFDFTGLGASDGEFENTDFSSNMGDLHAAARFLATHYHAPHLLIGHSLGGAAVLSVAGDMPSVKAVVTIGAPADVEHVTHNFGAHLDEIASTGMATVTLAGRQFTINRSFIEDLQQQSVEQRVAGMRKALLVMHSPTDETVGVDNASRIFMAAKHPKSFVALDGADHLVSRHEDSSFVAEVISSWADRYLPASVAELTADLFERIRVSETGQGKFQAVVNSGVHHLFADEPKEVGGDDLGPAPYDFLAIGLGACTVMTLRMYAARKAMDLPLVSVEVTHGKVPAAHLAEVDAGFEGRAGKVDSFERIIHVDGPVSDAVRDKLIEIAGKCPVHRTLESVSHVTTRLAD